ncbi:MAG: GGDEF domain-containing protein [Pseudorhodoplanes sp.]
MQIDAFTVLFFGLFVKALLGFLFLLFWMKDRSVRCFGWWATTLFLAAGATAFFMLRGFTADLLSIGLGNIILIAAFACCWQGARTFDGRPALWWPVFAMPAVWLALCLVPGFMENVVYRIFASSLLVAPILALCAYEFWRGRAEALPSRWPVIILFSSFALFFLTRIPLINVLPFPFGALPIEPGWVAGFNLVLFFHTLLLTVLIVAMSKERLELEQRNKAQTDALTGALNRLAFMTRGARMVLRHQLERKPMTLLFLDIDRFKSLNDRFGHSGGDSVLVAFVQVVQNNIRPSDYLFRIGGEEFCCLLPYTDASGAHRVAERIRHKFEVAPVTVAGVRVKTTVSIGIASTETFGYDIESLMQQADAAAYAAKRQGRNCVVVATAGKAVEFGEQSALAG